MQTRSFISAVLTSSAVIAFSTAATAHNVLDLNEGKAGYLQPLILNVNHGCKDEPVIGLRLKIPEEIVDAKAAEKPGWNITYKMRKLATPIMQHGREVTEVIDEIEWKDPVKPMPSDGWTPFEFRVRLPDMAGKVIYFKNITVCAKGTDPYVDVPKDALDIKDPDFQKKAAAFMRATPGPSPLFIIRPAVKKQYPWEWTPEQIRGEGLEQEARAK